MIPCVELLRMLAGTAELIDIKVGARFFATRTGDPSASLFLKKAEFTEECNIVVFDGADVETGTLTTVLEGVVVECADVALVVTAAFIEAIAIAICFSSNLIGVAVLVDVITVDGICINGRDDVTVADVAPPGITVYVPGVDVDTICEVTGVTVVVVRERTPVETFPLPEMVS